MPHANERELSNCVKETSIQDMRNVLEKENYDNYMEKKEQQSTLRARVELIRTVLFKKCQFVSPAAHPCHKWNAIAYIDPSLLRMLAMDH